MRLLTFREWLGSQVDEVGQKKVDSFRARTKHVAMVTELSLGEALERVQAYEAHYKTQYPLAVELDLIGVAEIETLTTEQLGRMMRIEELDVGDEATSAEPETEDGQ